MKIIKPALAQIMNPLLPDSTHVTDPKTYISKVIQGVLSIFFLVAVLYFIWHFVMAGYRLIHSQGDQKKLEEARDQITNALIGLIIVFSLFAVLKFIGAVTGLKGLEELLLPWPSLI